MVFETAALLNRVDRIAGHRLIVVGDVCLDEYLYGRAERLSREAAVPVLEFTHRELIPGGAANPGANIASLGSEVLQVGVVGADAFADQLDTALRARHIDPIGLIVDGTRPTTTKTRIMAQMGLRFPQQVARLDHIARHAVEGGVEAAIIARIDQLAAQTIDAIVASDYLTGLLTQKIVAAIRQIGRDRRILLTADAQGELAKYGGFDLVKCNADEAAAYLRRAIVGDTGFAEAGTEIVEALDLHGGMVITRGSDGLTLVEAGSKVTHLRAPHVEDVFDTVGAGDTTLAVMTLALVAGAAYPEAAALANLAAGFVVRKVGNYAPTRDDLRWAIQNWNPR
jgi:rfaE bifunctional protein kinase chain/domain